METVVEYYDKRGCSGRRISDPTGGTFDAAGDIDRLLDINLVHEIVGGLRILPHVEEYGTTVLESLQMPNLLLAIAALVTLAHPGPEERGWLRFQVMAELCRDQGGTLVFAAA